MRIHLPVLLGLFWMAQLSFAQPIKSNKNPPVQIKATASKPDADGKQKVTLQITLAKEVYIIANPAGMHALQTAAMKVAFSTLKGDGVTAAIRYPKGIAVKDEFLGKIFVYKRKVTIRAILDRKENKDPLRITLHCYGGWRDI